MPQLPGGTVCWDFGATPEEGTEPHPEHMAIPWMVAKSISHHRSERLVSDSIPQRKYQQAMGLNYGFKVVRNGFAHPRYFNSPVCSQTPKGSLHEPTFAWRVDCHGELPVWPSSLMRTSRVRT